MNPPNRARAWVRALSLYDRHTTYADDILDLLRRQLDDHLFSQTLGLQADGESEGPPAPVADARVLLAHIDGPLRSVLGAEAMPVSPSNGWVSLSTASRHLLAGIECSLSASTSSAGPSSEVSAPRVDGQARAIDAHDSDSDGITRIPTSAGIHRHSGTCDKNAKAKVPGEWPSPGRSGYAPEEQAEMVEIRDQDGGTRVRTSASRPRGQAQHLPGAHDSVGMADECPIEGQAADRRGVTQPVPEDRTPDETRPPAHIRNTEETVIETVLDEEIGSRLTRSITERRQVFKNLFVLVENHLESVRLAELEYAARQVRAAASEQVSGRGDSHAGYDGPGGGTGGGEGAELEEKDEGSGEQMNEELLNWDAEHAAKSLAGLGIWASRRARLIDAELAEMERVYREDVKKFEVYGQIGDYPSRLEAVVAAAKERAGLVGRARKGKGRDKRG